MENILFLLSAFLAEIIGTFTGFGTTTILVPLASFFIPIRDAIVMVGLFHLFGTFFRTLFFIKGINIRIALIFGIPSLIFSGLGAYLLPFIDASLLSKGLGIILILYALFSLSEHKVTLPQNPLVLASGGGLVGFLAGLLGTAGVLRGAFLTSWKLSKETYLGTGAAMGLGADFSRVFVYYKSGLLSFDPVVVSILAVVALLGTYVGVKFVKITKQNIFFKIVLIALILAGVRFLI